VVNPYESIVENCPDEKKKDIDYIMSLLDWEKNVDPDYRATYFRPPIVHQSNTDYIEKWICYGNEYFSAKELTGLPGRSVTY
jgi:hypothetical protein